MVRTFLLLLLSLLAAMPVQAATDAEKRAFVIEMADGLRQAPDKQSKTEGLEQCYRVHNRIAVEARAMDVGLATEIAMYAAVADCMALMFNLAPADLASRHTQGCTFLGQSIQFVGQLVATLDSQGQASAARYLANMRKAEQVMRCAAAGSADQASSEMEARLEEEIQSAELQMFSDATQAAARCNAAYTALAIGAARDIPGMKHAALSAQSAMCVALAVQLGGAPPQVMLRDVCTAVNAALPQYRNLMSRGGGVAEKAGDLLATAEEMANTHRCPKG